MRLPITTRTSHRGGLRLLAGDRLITHNVIVGSGTIAAGVLGVAFQSLVSHHLRPADYGAVFAVVTLITFIGMPAGALTVLMAREKSRDLALGDTSPSTTLLRLGNRALLVAGLALAVVLAAGAPVASSWLNSPPALIWAAAPGIPFALALPLLMGEFQGEQRFVTLSAVSAGQAGLKLVAAIALGLLFGPWGVVAGISVATITTYGVARLMVRSERAAGQTPQWWRPAAKYLAIVVPSTLALALLLSTDVFLVRRFFSLSAAGEYSSVAALGRSIFWGAAGVATVLFPKAVFASIRGQHARLLIAASLVLVALGGILGFGLLTIGSKWLLTSFAGPAYAAGASYLPWYALAMTLLGGVAVLIATHQSRGRAGFLAVLLPLAAVEPALIGLFHQTLLQVVQVVDISTALVLVGLSAWYLLEERMSRAVATPDVAAQVGAHGAPQLQVDR